MAGADPGMTIRNLVDTGVSPGRRFQLLFIGLGAGHLGAYSTMFHPAIPAYHQVLHLRISLRIHLRCRLRLRRRVPRPYSVRQRSITTDSGMTQVGGYRPQFRPHRGVICPGIEPGRLTRLATGRPSPCAAYLWRYRPSYRRTDPQITLRCALIERIGQLTTGCRGAGCHSCELIHS